MPRLLSPNTRQSPDYYTAVLAILIECNKEAMPYAAMADTLNGQKIKTATGLQWTAEHVRGLLKKLRNHRRYPNFLSQHLMELIFEGKLTLKETFPLLNARCRVE